MIKQSNFVPIFFLHFMISWSCYFGIYVLYMNTELTGLLVKRTVTVKVKLLLYIFSLKLLRFIIYCVD